MKIFKSAILFFSGIFISSMLFINLMTGYFDITVFLAFTKPSLIALLCSYVSIKVMKSNKTKKIVYFFLTHITYILIILIFGGPDDKAYLPAIIIIGFPCMLPILIFNYLAMKNLLK